MVDDAGEDDLEDQVSCAIRGFGGMSERNRSFLKTEDERSGKDVEVPVCCERFSDRVCFLSGDGSGLLLLRLLFFLLESLTKAGFILF